MVDEKEKGKRMSRTLVEARWLAGLEVKRAWLSYPVSGLFLLFLAGLASPGLSVIPDNGESGGLERAFASFMPDLLFLIVGLLLCVNSLSRDYLLVWTSDPFTTRLAFLRSLPISIRSLVAGRMLSMVLALPLTVPAFFVPVYFLTDLRELGVAYLWFVGIWVGYSFFAAGLTLLMELGLRGRTYSLISLGMIAAIPVMVGLLEWLVELRLVERTALLARDYGAAPAAVSLVLGAGLFVLLAGATVRRIESRELSA